MVCKTQTYVAIFSMMGMGMFSSIGSEAATYSPVIHTDVSQVDWFNKVSAYRATKDPQKQEQALKELLKDPAFQRMPTDWQEAVIQNVARFYVDGDLRKDYLLSSMLYVYRLYDELSAVPLHSKSIRGWIGVPQPEEPLNPKTGKRYVRVPKSLVQDLSPEDILYVKKVLNVVNQNLHYLNSLPPYMDPEKMEKGAYIGYAFWPLTLVQPKVLYEDSPYKSDLGKDHQKLVDMFAKGDEELYRLQSQMGTPLFNPHLIKKSIKINHLNIDCQGFSDKRLFGIRAIILSHCGGLNHFTLYAYSLYFKETQKSFSILRAGLAAEVAAQVDQPKLHKILTYIQEQTEPYLTKMEQATAYMAEQVWPSNPRHKQQYQNILGLGDRLLEIRIPKDVDAHEKTEKKLTPKERRLLKKQQRQREKELKKQQRQRS